MTEAGEAKRRLRAPDELDSLNDLLEEVRLRPSMWVRQSSLQHLDSLLWGYRFALEIHGIEEPFDLHPAFGPFAEWLWERLGMGYPSALGWAVEIERVAEQADRPAMEMFFELFDEFRDSGRGVQSVRHLVQPDPQASAGAAQPTGPISEGDEG